MDPDLHKPTQPILIFPFVIPKTKKIAYHTIFRSNHEASKDNLAKTSSVRDEFFTALESGNATSTITACEKYLPYLMGLVVSVESNPNLRLNSPLNFSWTSAVGSKTKYFVCYNYHYETIMTVMTYGFAHIVKASEVMSATTEESFGDNSKKAATLLKQAAGIFDYAASKEFPRWTDMPLEKNTELNLKFCSSVADYCCAAAQMITIKKGLLDGKTSKQVLAKLAVDVWHKSETMEKACKVLTEYKDLEVGFKNFITFQHQLSKSMAYCFMGESAYADGKVGHAVGYLMVAFESLPVWIPSSSNVLFHLSKEIETTKDYVSHMKRTYEMENDHIHIQKVPEAKALEIFESKCLMLPTAWVPPEPAYTSLSP